MISADRPHTIYALQDPRTLAVRYVGATAQSLRLRLKVHLQTAHKNRTPCCRWVRELMRLNLRPVVILLERVDGNVWEDAERRWIKHFRKSGANLTNVADGGEGGGRKKYTQAELVHLNEIARAVLHAPRRHPGRREKCIIEDCMLLAHGKGLCQNHYMAAKRTLIPKKPNRRSTDKRFNRKNAACTVEGCDGKHQAHGLCKRHYEQVRLTGSIVAPKQPNPPCRECGEPYWAKGLCRYHYAEERKHTAPRCSVEDCQKPVSGHGLCENHVKQQQRRERRAAAAAAGKPMSNRGVRRSTK